MLTHSSHPRAWFHYSQWESLLLAGSFKNWVQIWFFLGLLLRLFSLEGLLEPPDTHGRGNPVLFFIPITGALFWWELSGRRWWWRLTSYQEGTRRPFSSSMFSVCLPSLSAKSLSGSVTSKGWLLYGEPIHQEWKQYTEQPVALPHHTALSLYKLPFEHVSHEMCKNMGMIFFPNGDGLAYLPVVSDCSNLFWWTFQPRLAKQQECPAEGCKLCEIQHCGGEALYIVLLRERGWN